MDAPNTGLNRTDLRYRAVLPVRPRVVMRLASTGEKVNKSKTVIMVLAICWLAACRREPANFNDCILHSVKSGMSERAVQLVTRACREKFPEEGDNTTRMLLEFPDDARNKLNGHFGQSVGSTWSGNIYNANEDWTVEEVTLLITPQTDPLDTGMIVEEPPERYKVRVRVPPLSNSTFSLSVNWRGDQAFDWTIVSAKGSKAP